MTLQMNLPLSKEFISKQYSQRAYFLDYNKDNILDIKKT